MQIKPIVSTALLLACLAPSAHAAGLPDTGQRFCDNGGIMDPCSSYNSGDAAVGPRQDGRFGRDPVAFGTSLDFTRSGFDYTRVCNSGELAGSGSCPADPVLGVGANEWGCTQDNITGLMWEVKVNDTTHLRHRSWEYAWYDSNPATNGGDAGSLGTDTCGGTLSGYSNQCNTENYIDAVNTATLCGYSDWRLPQKRELRSILHFGYPSGSTDAPAIAFTHFPNTWASYWSAAPYGAGGAFTVIFIDGTDWVQGKSGAYRARLVRGGPF